MIYFLSHPTPVSCLAASTCATYSLLCYMGTGVPPQVFDEEPQLSWVVLVWLLVLAQSMWSR